jgi:hypothetical protein
MPDGHTTTVDFEQIKADLRQRADNAGRVEPKARYGVIDAASLQDQEFPPIKYVIPGYVPEGLTILAGKPKLGKSWLSLDWAIAVAYGGTAMESITCDQGDVLYAALEDNQRRLQSRMQTLLPDPHMRWPARLQFATSMDTLDQGGVEFVRDWIEAATDPRLVIVDTLQKVRGSRSDRETAYESDYKAVAALQALAAEKGVAIVLVHHVRKLDADDPIDKVSGTLGLTGCADTTLVLDRKGGGEVTLYGRGRDTEEIEQAVQFSKESCRWSILGDAGKVAKSTERGRIRQALEGADEPLTATEVAALAEMTVQNARKLLSLMVRDGEAERAGRGRYRIPTDPDGDDDVNAENTDTVHTVHKFTNSPEGAENCASEGSENVNAPEAAFTNADGDLEDVNGRSASVHKSDPQFSAGSEAICEHVNDVNAGEDVHMVDETVDVRLYGGSTKYASGRAAYRASRQQAPALEARGWTPVHQTRDYVYLQPPKGVRVRKNKAQITITRPSDDDLDRLAQAVHAASVPDQGEVGGWPWSYEPAKRQEGRYETVVTMNGEQQEWRRGCTTPAFFRVGDVGDVWCWSKRFGELEVDHDA